jgi:hypothetical protein
LPFEQRTLSARGGLRLPFFRYNSGVAFNTDL